MGTRLPEILLTPGSLGDVQNRYKFQQYTAIATKGAASGLVPNEEYYRFRGMVERGFVPDSAEGLTTMLGWLGKGNWAKETAGYFDVLAFEAAFAKAPFAGEVLKARSNGGARAPEWVAALEAEYGLDASSVPLPYVRPAATAPVAVVLRPQTQIVASNSPSLGGYTGHWPTLAWRILQLDSRTGVTVKMGPWSSWKGAFLGPLSSETTNTVFWEDVQQDVALGGERSRAYWDYPALQAAVAASGGGPPPAHTYDDVMERVQPVTTQPIVPNIQAPHGDVYIPPGVPVTTAVDGTLVPNVVAQNQPPLLLTGGGTPSPEQQGGITPPVNPAEGLARFGQGFGLIIMAGVGYYLWNKRR